MADDDQPDQPDDTRRPSESMTAKELAAAFARASAPRAAADDAAADEEPLDPQTRADLERWFGLPSYQELAERPEVAPVIDPEMAAVRERRAKAIAAVDPALLEAHRRRVEPDPEHELPQPLPPLHTFVATEMTLFDHSSIDRGFTIAEPREVEIPAQLSDDLRERTPQALLRDLHRLEASFDRQLEIIDYGAGTVGLDVGATVKPVMAERYQWRQPASVFAEARAEFAEVFANRTRPWVDVLSTYLPNRREGMS